MIFFCLIKIGAKRATACFSKEQRATSLDTQGKQRMKYNSLREILEVMITHPPTPFSLPVTSRCKYHIYGVVEINLKRHTSWHESFIPFFSILVTYMTAQKHNKESPNKRVVLVVYVVWYTIVVTLLLLVVVI